MLGAVVYTIAAAYIILRVLRAFSRGGAELLLRHLRILLCVICAVLVYAISGDGTLRLIAAFEQLKAGNTGTGDLTLSYVFIVLQFVVDSLPYVLNMMIIFSGFGLIDALQKGQYGDEVVPAARGNARLCRAAIVIIMLSQIAVNVLQLILGPAVRNSHYTRSKIFAICAALVLALTLGACQLAKEDGELYVETSDRLVGAFITTEYYTLQETSTLEENGEITESGTKVTVRIAVKSPAKLTRVIQMSASNTPLAQAAYAPENLPESIDTDDETAYVIVETQTLSPMGESVKREIYNPGDGSFTAYTARDDGICEGVSVQIIWDDVTQGI